MPLAILTFLVSVAYIPGVPSHTTVGRWFVMGVGVAYLIRRASIHAGIGHWMGAAFLVWCMASLAWSASPNDTIGMTIQMLILAGVFCLAAEEKDLSLCFEALAAGMVISAAFGVFQIFGFRPTEQATGGAAGLFASKNTLAETAAVALVGVIALRKWAYLPGVAFAAIAPLSRGALVALAAIGGWTAISMLETAAKRAMAVLAGGLVVVGLIALDAWMNGSRLESLNERLMFWQVTAANLTALGYGLGSYSVILPTWEHAHNEFLEYGFDLGLGALLLGGIIVHAFRSKQGTERAALAALMVAAFFSFPFHEPAAMFLVALLAGHLCGSHDRCGVDEYGGRYPGRQSIQASWPTGIGALSEVDFRRLDLPLRPQHQKRGGTISRHL
jgi:hypothetical protein